MFVAKPSESRHPSDDCENVKDEKLRRVADPYLKSWSLAIVTFSLCLGTLLVALDVNIIGVAVPKISAVFQSLDDIAWYGSAYLLTVTAFQPITGFIYKFFDVRTTYISSVIIFEGKTWTEFALPPVTGQFCYEAVHSYS